MNQKHPEHLPDAELAVMQALWSLGGSAARPLLDTALAERGWPRRFCESGIAAGRSASFGWR